MIGVFDSGFGGLTVLKSIVSVMPDYDYLYLGDNARVPYGTRSQRMVYEFTKQAVEYLFHRGCPLVIIACNTASARALRKIQQEFLPEAYPDRRVLGVIRPSAEEIVEKGMRSIGILATEGVVASGIYVEEITSLAPDIRVYQQACPLLVPIIEAGEAEWEGTDMIISKYLRELFNKGRGIEAILLACTHYPILHEQFVRQAGSSVAVLDQGPIVAEKLKEYLARHSDIEDRISRNQTRCFLTTDTSERFDRLALVFYGEPVTAQLVSLDSLCL